MDSTGKIIWAKNADIETAMIKTAGTRAMSSFF